MVDHTNNLTDALKNDVAKKIDELPPGYWMLIAWPNLLDLFGSIQEAKDWIINHGGVVEKDGPPDFLIRKK